MCTVSVSCRGDGFELWFNRDEQHSRAEGIAPQLNGTTCRWVGPRDGDAGGTWIGCNEHGLTIGLLNLYESTVPTTAAVSRGQLVKRLLEQSRGPVDAVTRWDRMDFGELAPHRMLIAARGAAVRIGQWDGRSRVVEERVLPVMLTSSSVNSAAVCAVRRARWRAIPELSPAAQADFHTARDEADPAAGVLMQREDARTVSITHITVGADRVAMSYWPVDRAGNLGTEHRMEMAIGQGTGRR